MCVQKYMCAFVYGCASCVYMHMNVCYFEHVNAYVCACVYHVHAYTCMCVHVYMNVDIVHMMCVVVCVCTSVCTWAHESCVCTRLCLCVYSHKL